ncbi:hypothetical protein BHM03_00005860 [Ensete ventricosum]|nr:hypothetical protein BHM03_00005860 [Ensete ventricosum]
MPDLPSDSHQSPPIRQENPNKSSPALGKKETTTVTSKWETSTRTTDLKREQGRFPVRGAAVPRAALGWSENRDGRGGAAEQHWGRSSGLELLHKVGGKGEGSQKAKGGNKRTKNRPKSEKRRNIYIPKGRERGEGVPSPKVMVSRPTPCRAPQEHVTIELLRFRPRVVSRVGRRAHVDGTV